MLPDLESEDDTRRKQLAALKRAVPVTRMVDYGVPLGDAIHIHESSAIDSPVAWDNACEQLALRHVRRAEASSGAGHRLTACRAWRTAAALLQCAQLAHNEDLLRKKALYEHAHAAMRQHAALSGDLAECTLPTPAGNLHAWVIQPRSRSASSAVVVLGGLSGWGAAYLDMGRALAARGLLAILGEGPGQGLTRMRSGLHLSAHSLPLFTHFVDYAQALSARRIGVWGNSFGGLFGAHLAILDSRVGAVCINGAPMTPTVPDFRTAREQMAAVFGTTQDAALAARVEALALDPQRHRTNAAMLVVQGGRDPLAPLGSQDGFFRLCTSPIQSSLTWDDGEHTLYNHAQERNDEIADWFVKHLETARP